MCSSDCRSPVTTPLPVGDGAYYISLWDGYNGVQFRSFTRPQMSLDKIAVRSSASGLSRLVTSP